MSPEDYVRSIVQAISVLSSLNLFANDWPPQAAMNDGEFVDYIVVGAGTAGCVVAARLAEDKKTKVLLIEAGGDPPHETTLAGALIFLERGSVDWNYTTENDGKSAQCQKKHVEDLMLGKVLGGTSTMNHLMYSQGHYKDYNNWAKIVDHDNWNWENVLPYIVKATNLRDISLLEASSKKFYGTAGPVGVTIDMHKDFKELYLQGFKEAGYDIVPDINAERTSGYAKAMYYIADGVRQSSANAYLRPIKDFPNLLVWKNTEAKQILLDDQNNAVGVEVVTEDGKTMTVKSRKEVIVSCGAVKSPQLLMLSGIGPKEHLEKKGIKVISDLPVGKNFHDQVSTILILNMTKLENSNITRDPHAYPGSSFVGYFSLNDSNYDPDCSTLSWVNQAHFLNQFCSWTYGLPEKLCKFMFGSNTNPMVWTLLDNLHPKSRGEVLLRTSDYTIPPIVRTGHYSNKEDLEIQVKCIEKFVRVVNTTSYINAGAKLLNPKLALCAKYEFASKEYWRCYAKCMMNTKRNYCGTNAMGSVVDSRLRVKGVHKLRVADASVMPAVTSGDAHLPTLIIGEKAADMIKEDNKDKHQ